MSGDYQVIMISYVNAKELAEVVADAISDRHEMVEFVMALDEEVADLDFTVAVRDRLNAAIELESETISPTGGVLLTASELLGGRTKAEVQQYARTHGLTDLAHTKKVLVEMLAKAGKLANQRPIPGKGA